MHLGRTPLRVTGYSMLSALGRGREAHLEALSTAATGLGPAPMPLPFDTAVGEVRSELPELPADLAPRTTRIARMSAALIQELEEPLRQARERWNPERIAVILGTSTAGAETTERAYRTFVDEGSFPEKYNFQKQHTFGAVLKVVSELAGAKGPAWMVSTACTSSGKPSGPSVCPTRSMHAIRSMVSSDTVGFRAKCSLPIADVRKYGGSSLSNAAMGYRHP